jgi:hypothetical protein
MVSPFLIIGIVLVLVVLGALFGPSLMRQMRSEKPKDVTSESGYDFALQTMGDERRAQRELDERQKHVQTVDIQPLSAGEEERFRADWAAAQAKFVNEPGPAMIDADHLVKEVMQVRGYPVANFEQNAANIAVNHPDLVIHFRAVRDFTMKNKQTQAGPEELSQIMMDYHSLFDELLGDKPVLDDGK